MEQSKGEITAEQVERAIAKPRNIDYRELPRGWRELAPAYVLGAWEEDDWDVEHAALTRWRDELTAAEREQRDWLDHVQRLDEAAWWCDEDIARCEDPRSVCDPRARTRYADALSAEEARRAAVGAWAAGGGVLHYSPPTEPERPAPRFKVGDRVTSGMGGPWKIGRVGWGRLVPEADCDEWVYHHASGNVSACESVLALAWTPTPASPPAPEVVDVPQPIVKRCGGVEAQWDLGEDHVTLVEPARGVGLPAPLALLRAMLAAIDAQQGGAS